MSSEQRSARAPAHNTGSPRQRLFALLRSTDGRLGLIAYIAFMSGTVLSSIMTYGKGWRHPNLLVLDGYKLSSVAMWLTLLVLLLRFLWRLPLWAHGLFTLGLFAFFIDLCYSPLFIGVEGPFADAADHLVADVLGPISISLMLLGGFPVMVAGALNKFRMPPPEEHHWFMAPRQIDTLANDSSPAVEN